MEKVIRKKVRTTHVEFSTFDPTRNEIVDGVIELPFATTSIKSAEKAVAKTLSDNVGGVIVRHMELVTRVYEMPLEQFVQLAKTVDVVEG